jgi:aminoglycoside 6'-N-acetyltransferase I
MVEIKVLGSNDARTLERVAADVFDHEVNPEWAAAFLRDEGHHLAVALEGGVVVGFASGVTYLHPDKPIELWINEVGVAKSHQGQGIGKGVVRALLKQGRSLGCGIAWVLTDRSNVEATRLYAAVGGTLAEGDTVMYEFTLE